MPRTPRATTTSARLDERTEQGPREPARGRDRSAVLRETIHRAYEDRLYAQAREDAERLVHDKADKAEPARIAEVTDGTDRGRRPAPGLL
ncbi:hypothetical protein NGM33_12555 [Nocardiopsis dassonvillei]|uniref:hypothetical protein n=1 Tax=Nocardiopsis dassonvillei TaxID=2014 RepID=UPI00102AD73C|nr:hypothetical protein [Nocardiopsis dassonvillei]MCP3014165.1 hypothetical protein [Nocardiopsis dassonvillei]